MYSVVPSLPAASFIELENLASSLRGTVKELQVDIVDGNFVEAIAWPFTATDPREEFRKIAQLTKDFAIGVDCMVEKPEQYLDLFVELSCKRVIIHMRSTEVYEEIISHARLHGYQIGLAFTNDVPLLEIEPYIKKIDFVQIMGIAVVGKQGQPFDERTLETARTFRVSHPNLEIAVDGSVNENTIVALKNAGVNRFAPGSAIAKQPNPLEAYHHLMSLIS